MSEETVAGLPNPWFITDPLLRATFETAPRLALNAESLAACRAAVPAIVAAARPDSAPSESLHVHEAFVEGPAGTPLLRLIITSPASDGRARPGILHIHGGGFVLGSADMNREIDALYARTLGAVCVSVDFRLPPETPHPGPVQDCYAALAWLHGNAAVLGVDQNNITVSGESGGGGLAAALVLLARDRGEIPIAFQHLIYPMLDDRTGTPAGPALCYSDYLWSPENNSFCWACLIGGVPGADGVSPYAAPARAERLAGLPPSFIACGALDLFVEENLDYAKRLIGAGVQVELHIYPGAPHGFDIVSNAPVSQAFSRDSLNALARAMRLQNAD